MIEPAADVDRALTGVHHFADMTMLSLHEEWKTHRTGPNRHLLLMLVCLNIDTDTRRLLLANTSIPWHFLHAEDLVHFWAAFIILHFRQGLRRPLA